MKYIFTILLILIVLGSQAATYYVSNSDGNDSDSGLTEALAWKTLAKVNAATFAPGDNILFKKGDTWEGSLIVPSSGTLANRITFSSYGTGANPIITGFTTVSSWTNLGSNIWESTSAVSALSTCNVVSINGVLTPMGRYPNSDTANKGYLTYTSSTTTSLTSANLTGTPNWTGAEVLIRTTNFTMDRRVITSQSTSTINWTTATGRTPENGFGFFIQNDSRTLDQQNEWYFNPSTKKIRIYSTSQPINVKVTSVDKLFTVTRSYVTVNGIDFVGANTYAIWHDTSDTPAKTYLTVQNCNISFTGTSGVLLRGTYISYLNNTVTNSNGSGLNTSTNSGNVTITGNTLTNIGIYPGQATVHAALSSGNYTSNVLVQNNIIQNVGFNGVTFHGTNITVKNNFIDTFCQIMDDGGGIYTYTGSEDPLSNVLVEANVITNGVGSPEGTNLVFPAIAAGIYCDNDSEGITIKDNSIYRARKFGLFLNDANDIIMTGNTVFDTWEEVGKTASQFRFTYPADVPQYPADLTITGNKFVSKQTNQWTIDFFSYFDLTIPFFGTANNNVYARPIDDNKTIYADQPSEWSGGNEDKTLAEWKIFSSQDVATTKSPISVSSVNDIQFMYNETATPKNVSLNWAAVDMNGTKKVGIITLAPFTSGVYLKDPNPAPTPPAGVNRIGISGGKFGLLGNRPGLR